MSSVQTSGASSASTAGVPALEVTSLRAGYFGRPVVYDATFRVEQGTITALFGHNSAGKTTTLRTIAGLMPSYAGEVRIFGEVASGMDASSRVKRGVVYLPQERTVFPDLSVTDNLRLGAALVNDKEATEDRLKMVTSMFPRLGERLRQRAGTMSGGEQRMLSMGIALMAGARILLLDEPSLGLAPVINQTLLNTAKRLATEEGVSVLLVEQAIGSALQVADHVYVMRGGEIVAEHTGDEARARDDWWTVF